MAQRSSEGTYQVAYGMVRHLISEIRAQGLAKWPTRAPRVRHLGLPRDLLARLELLGVVGQVGLEPVHDVAGGVVLLVGGAQLLAEDGGAFLGVRHVVGERRAGEVVAEIRDRGPSLRPANRGT